MSMKKALGALALVSVSLLASIDAPAQGSSPHSGAARMEISRRADLETVEGPAEYFTGKATITGQFQREEPSRLSGAIVRFEAGARTAWHTHPLGQTLIVTEGVGWTQVEGGPVQEFEAGDVLWCPPGRKHWHGATPNGPMTHIALQEARNGSPVTWMEKVTDEDYLAASKR